MYRYYCSLDGAQQRLDKFDKPELLHGSVDFAVTKDYCVTPPQVGATMMSVHVNVDVVWHIAGGVGCTDAYRCAQRVSSTCCM